MPGIADSLCAAQCSCESVIVAGDDSLVSLTAAPVSPHFALLPTVTSYKFPVLCLADRVHLVVGTRAPPRLRPRRCRSLRAPPVFLPMLVIVTNGREVA